MTSHAALHMDPVDPMVFRRTMGTFATGVAVVTAVWDGEYHGMTMNSLTSVSLDPCMLLICPRRGSATGEAIANSGEFIVNLLRADHHDIVVGEVTFCRERTGEPLVFFQGRFGGFADRTG